jgi:protein TonB
MPGPVPQQESWPALTPDGESSAIGAPKGSSVRPWPARFWLISGTVHLLLFVAVSFVLRDTSEAPFMPPLRVTLMAGGEAVSLLDDVSLTAQSRPPERQPLPPNASAQPASVYPDPVPSVPSTPVPPPITPERSPPPLVPENPTPALIEVVPELKTVRELPPLRPPSRVTVTDRSAPESAAPAMPMTPSPPIVAQTPAPRPPQTAPRRDVPRQSRPMATFDEAVVARVPPTGQQHPSPPAAANSIPRTADTANPPPRPSRAASVRYGQNPAPAYPSEARRHGWEGTVLLLVEILENGRPERITVKQSSGYSVLDEAALGAVRRWTFIPAQRDGQPIRSLAEVPIVFSLRNGR